MVKRPLKITYAFEIECESIEKIRVAIKEIREIFQAIEPSLDELQGYEVSERDVQSSEQKASEDSA